MLPEVGSRFRAVYEAFCELFAQLKSTKYQDSTTAYERFFSAFQSFVRFNKQVLTYNLLKIQEESSQASCRQPLREQNKIVMRSLHYLQNSWETLLTYANLSNTLLADKKCNISKSNRIFIIQQSISALDGLKKANEDFSACLGKKLSLENQDNVTPVQKISNERLNNNQMSMGMFIGKLRDYLEEYLSFLMTPKKQIVRGYEV
eukprot:TRINITY_DN1928_c0_g1_i1.p1 TRINITY_DN1928_c0_g1~~TRINITY_DN1928_c0_g1_i1.p1  ORF type:complete len:204 (-),score=46.08 TRINITY_DN1928_c0_g1_i1:1269-1880(-)